MREMRQSAPEMTRSALRAWAASALALLTAGTLLCLGAANVAIRASWHEGEDGVLWVARAEGVTAAQVAGGTAGEAAGVRPGDVLIAVDGQPIEVPSDVVSALHRHEVGGRLRYTVVRLGERQLVDLTLTPIPQGNRPLYYILAAIGIFTLLVGTAVRLRRPRAQATLHFFWLCLAFFGTFTYSFTGRLDTLDWFFYWADSIALLALGPLFMHFTLVFPERARLEGSLVDRALVPLLYLPPLLLGAARVLAFGEAGVRPDRFIAAVETLDRIEPLYVAVYLLGALLLLVRALNRVRTGTARRQLRWIVWGTALGAAPFALAYALPYSTGVKPTLPMELSAIPLSLVPLAFASAIVRYRLTDVEVIVKRGLVWTAALAASLAIYAVLLRFASNLFLTDPQQSNTVIAMLATMVVVLLARPVKSAIQNALDRAFYRDRYDYRRALGGFARDLNSDLDLGRLSDRLVMRVTETLLVERMVLLLADEGSSDLVPIHARGVDEDVPRLSRTSDLARRLAGGDIVSLDDADGVAHWSGSDGDRWLRAGIHHFVPCVAKGNLIAVLALGAKESSEPLSSEDLALLAAVAGQVATAIENGRLYRQLRVKADEVERMREFNENIVESLDDGLVVADANDRIVRWNRALEQLYGPARWEVIGRGLHEMFDGAFIEALRAARREMPSGATLYRVPLVGRGAQSGRRLLVNVATVPLQTAAGNLSSTTGTLIIIEDVTSRVRLEEQLQISEKMASIGVLAAGVAHEVNTPLTGISSFTQMLLEGADPEDPRTKVLEKIERQTFRAARIVNGLLTLSRSGHQAASERLPVDLNAVISDVLTLLEHQLEAASIKVRRDFASPGVVVNGMEHKLQQVFLNLFLNARDAMPRGGWLSVTTREADGQAVVEVADTGSGIPTEHLSRIYDPFFTTKAIGHGTGLGLSITYGIVREHDGTLSCDSTVGQGTRFVLALPITSAKPAKPAAAVQ
jgi:PAS domain S-box-containing protein